jgi:hypothetical protein
MHYVQRLSRRSRRNIAAIAERDAEPTQSEPSRYHKRGPDSNAGIAVCCRVGDVAFRYSRSPCVCLFRGLFSDHEVLDLVIGSLRNDFARH